MKTRETLGKAGKERPKSHKGNVKQITPQTFLAGA